MHKLFSAIRRTSPLAKLALTVTIVATVAGICLFYVFAIRSQPTQDSDINVASDRPLTADGQLQVPSGATNSSQTPEDTDTPGNAQENSIDDDMTVQESADTVNNNASSLSEIDTQPPSTPSPSNPSTTPPSTEFKANCIVTPSACGYPDATNTGVPPGTALTSSGSITVSQDGAVIERLNITGSITINANNVTIRKTRITSGDYYPIDYASSYTGLIVEDTEIIGTSSSVTAAISFANYTARRVNVSGTADGFKADSNVIIEDSYVHDLAVNIAADTHNDGVQTTGGSNVTLRHNTFKLSTVAGVNACVQMGNEWGSNDNWLVTDNLFDGGGWIINASPAGSNRTFSYNRFTRNSAYGVGDVANSVWTGNYYDDNGEAIDDQ